MRSLLFFASVTIACARLHAEPCLRAIDTVPTILVPGPEAVDVPRNVTPLLARPDDGIAPRLLVGEEQLALVVETFTIVDGFGATEWSQLVPVERLPENALVAIEVDGAVAGTFTTGTFEDDDAPQPPTLGTPEPFSGGSCTPFVQIPFTGTGDAAFFIATTGADMPNDLAGAVLSGATSTSPIVVSGDDGATAEVQVAAVDQAGHVSAANVVDVTFPFGEGAPLPLCSHAARSPQDVGISGVAALGVCGVLCASSRRRERK